MREPCRNSGSRWRIAAAGARAVVLVAGVMAPAWISAAPFDGNPKALIHVVAAPVRSPCDNDPISDCRAAVTHGDVASGKGPFYYAYLVLARGQLDGIAAAQCGISYGDDRPGDAGDGRGIDVFEWRHCAVVDVPSPGPPTWPAPGGANIIAWGLENCRREESAVAGYFYMGAYGSDSLYVMPWPLDGRFVVADCDAREVALERKALGLASFTPGDAIPGCNPCHEGCPSPDLPPAPPPPAAPKILVHVTPAGQSTPCAPSVLPDCTHASVRGGLSSPGGPYYFVHLLVSKSSAAFNIGAIRCGIFYDTGRDGDASNGRGIDVLNWTLCASDEITGAGPNPWPQPGGGNLVLFQKCPTTAVAHAGYFYVAAYEADQFRVIRYPTDEPTDVQSCGGNSFPVDERFLGFASFSAGSRMEGCNPCRTDCSLPVPVRATTWSAIKTLSTR